MDDNMSLDHDEFRMFTLYAIDKQMESRHTRARACTHAPRRAPTPRSQRRACAGLRVATLAATAYKAAASLLAGARREYDELMLRRKAKLRDRAAKVRPIAPRPALHVARARFVLLCFGGAVRD